MEQLLQTPNCVEQLRAALATAIYYHPAYDRNNQNDKKYVQNSISKVMKGDKLESIHGMFGDAFASVYNNVLRLNPQHYYEMAKLFFVEW